MSFGSTTPFQTALPCGVNPCQLDGPVVSFFAGDTWTFPLTWWQTPPVYASDGVTITTPGVPVNMTGLTPTAELLSSLSPAGVSLAISSFVPTAGSWTVTATGFGTSQDMTSALPRGPASASGPRIRVHYLDGTGNRTTFGTFYVQVK